MTELAKYIDVFLIDTGAAIGVKMAAIMSLTGFVISPIELEKYSIMGIKKTMTTIVNAKNSDNPTIEFLGILPCRCDFTKPRQRQNYADLQRDIAGLLAPLKIHSRDSIAEALDGQKPVWAVKKTAAREAAKEMRELCQYIFEKLNLESK